jgi:hypothetical protein
MKSITQIVLIASLVIFSSCRKDAPLVGLNPQGNVLVLQVDKEYNIEKSAELNINSSSKDGKLDLKSFYQDIGTSSHVTIYSESSSDKVMHFKDGVVQTPTLENNSRTQSRDGRLMNQISNADFVPFGSVLFSMKGLVENVGDSKLLHGYFDQSAGRKISILPIVLREYDEELQSTIPVRKYYLICGLE